MTSEPTGKRISRRALLRGAGVSIALPLLEAMCPTTARAAPSRFQPLANSAGAHPRLICCYVPQYIESNAR